MKSLADERALRRKLARRDRDAWRGKLGRGRYDTLVRQAAGVIRLSLEAGAIFTPFGLEGPLRHSIRAALCRQGWNWRAADLMARDLLEETFKALRASRPDWDEGQPEWIIEAGTLIERTRCARCHRPLPEGHRKYCGSLCRVAHHMFWARRKEATEENALTLAVNSI